MFDRILVPTDGSDQATMAADDAISLASAHDATLYVVSVADPGPFGDVRLPGEAETPTNLLRDRARQLVTDVVDRAEAASVDVTDTVLSGPPGSEILDYADEVDADLIVMGTRGRGGIRRMAVGSVTDHVIRFGDVRVLAVQGSADES